jgi:single-strand DNA-binding protein
VINKIILVGRITKDPELKTIPSGSQVVNFSIAVNRNYTDPSGEKKTDFIECVIWGKQAENLSKYVKKGFLLGIEGKLQQKVYETESGTRYTYEVHCDSIQFLESKSSGQTQTQVQSHTEASDEFYETSKKLAAEEDLPF